LKKIFRWMRAHKVRTVLLLILILFLAEAASIPWFGVPALRSSTPVETALMRQRLSEAEREGKPLRIVQHWIGYSRIPRHLIDAVVVAEDGTFFSHGGFDWFEVRESIAKNVRTRSAARGASTITQQLAKNLYLSTSKDPIRKLKEGVITLLLEKWLSKERILELYLNLIEWGRGIFGVEAAAQTYFGKSASALTLEESLRLAAVIPSPLRHRPDQASPYVLRRSQIVEDRLVARRMGKVPEKMPEDLPDEQESGAGADSIRVGEEADSAVIQSPVEGAGIRSPADSAKGATSHTDGGGNGL
jgi:monofunctional biosynthetic peptidoglycan transglycosylase